MSKRKRKRPDKEPRSFRGNPDYKSEFERAVNALIDAKISDRAERMTTVQSLIDEYVMAVGARPDGRQLERLTNEILREELTDDDEHKMAREEYPIMSDTQYQRRKRGQRGSRPSNMRGETNIPLTLGADLQDYREPTRRKRNKYEQIWLDKNAKIRNAERRRAYNAFVRPSEVTVSYLSTQ